MSESIQQSNSRAPFVGLAAAMWLALPFTAYRYWSVWDRLPARIATHFGADGRPNGWMTLQQSLTFSLMTLGFLLIVFTVVLLYASRRAHSLDAISWALLGLFYVVVGVMTYITDSVLEYNVVHSEIPLASVAIGILVATLLFVVIFLRLRRGSVLAESTPIIEENHTSHAMAFICVVVAALMIAILMTMPALGVKLVLSATAFVVLACGLMAWDGFHYLFSHAGIEIRTLGFRLRSIPASEIQNYNVERWNLARGYGIRGVGNDRAYVWGNSGVRIKTTRGEVFLGHSEPGRIIRDLDVITNQAGKHASQRT